MVRILKEEEIARLYEALFGKMPPIKIQVGKTALVIIDVQNMFCDPSCGHLRAAIDKGAGDLLDAYLTRIQSIVIPNIKKLLRAARTAGLDIIHVRIAGTRDDGRDMSQRYKDLGITASPNSRETQVIEELAPLPNETLLSKITSSIFHSSSIDRLLRSMDINSLVVCGVVTNGCVEASVRSAADLGYRVLVVEDACAAFAPQLHEASIRNMALLHAVIDRTDNVSTEMFKIGKG